MKRINKIRIKYALLISFFIILATVLPTFMRYQASVTANVVGYAKETRRSTYKVNFHSNGGTGTMASMTVNYNEAVNLIPNTFTNEPSHFAGWNTQADGMGTNYRNEQEIIETDYITGNQIDLYAKWAQGIAEVDGNFYQTLQAAVDAVPNNVQKTVKLLADTEEQITIKKLQNIIFDLQDYTVSKTSGKDGVFENYGTIRITNGTLTSSVDGAVLNNYPGATAYISGGNLIGTSTLKGQAVYNKGGTVEISGTAYLSSVSTNRPTVHHLDYNSNIAITRILGGTIIGTSYYAVGNEKGANAVEIGSKDGNVSTTTPVIQSGTYGISSYSNNDGRFKFYDGIIKGKTGAINNEATLITDVENYCEIGHSQETINNQTYKTAYLQNTANVREVTFNPNGGNVSEPTRRILIGDPVGTLPTPTREGYVFNGWFTLSEGGDQIDATTIITADVEYFAQWEKAKVVTFSPNGGTVSEPTRSIISGNPIGTLPTPTRDGYAFIGWFTLSDGGDQIDATTIITADVEYFAHWRLLYFAQIGNTKYNSLSAALNAVPTTNVQTTITLLQNSVGSFKVAKNKNVLLDLNGYTLSVAENKTVIENSGTLLITNGTLSSTQEFGTINNLEGAVLRITDGNYSATQRAVIYNTNGTVEISGGTFTSNATGNPNNTNVPRATIQNVGTNGTITITGGTIIGTTQHAISGDGPIIIGIKDSNISSTSPVIRGKQYGVWASGTLDFYDGAIKGVADPIYGTITDTEANSTQVTGTETIGSDTYKTLHLE